MAKCDYCGSSIWFGGVTAGNYRFCNANCQRNGYQLIASNLVSEESLMQQVRLIHQGTCPRCNGPGPVDVHLSYRVWSILLMTSWNSRPHVCCRPCGRKEQIQDFVFSLFLGWWGFPWGLIMTPVQLIQNLSAMASGPDGSRPSDTLRRLIQIHIGANSVAQQNHSGLARGDDLRLDLELTFQEAIFGCEKEVQIMHLERDGAGGTVQVARALKIEVPAGVDSGTRLRVAGEGDAGANNGESGDLYLYLLAPTEADGWKREDINILSDLKITKAQGQNGDQVTVNTIHGEAILTIPPGTTSGDQLTLKGKGVPKLGYPNQKGDHIVRILL